MREERREGWGFPPNSRKAHYFVKEDEELFGRSLCGKWLFAGELEEGNGDSLDNCVLCIKKLKKRREKHNAQKERKKEKER
jgi:hypothetical protein